LTHDLPGVYRSTVVRHYRRRIVETSPTGAPAVVAIVVTRNPGAWFDEAMASLASQDYPNLAVLVVDAASDVDPGPRVAAHLPDAFVRRLDANVGFGRAINDSVGVVDGADFYLCCHDDVALAPGAIRTLVEEAFRSNAGVVGPKLVTWGDGSRLLSVGESVDKSGTRAALVDRYELDQEQHDAVRDVYVIPGAVTLIRADLFETIGGFDPAIDYHNDDLALCWKAHLAGARVVVTPDAVVRHVEALGDRQPVEDRRRLQNLHRVRTVLTCYSPFHLLRVLPQMAIITVVEVLYALVIGRTRQARDLTRAWTANLRDLKAIRAQRAVVQAFRTVPDSEIRNLQVRGSARFSAFLRGQLGDADEDRFKRATAAGRDLAASMQQRGARLAIGAWVATAVVLIVGSRHLLTGGVPAIGEFAAFESGAVDTVREWISGWRSVGLGSESPNPTLLGMAGLTGLVSFGSMSLARLALILGLLPLGMIGTYRLLAPTGSRRAQVAALIASVALPLPYLALSNGRWGALALWAGAPWMLGQLARASGLAPFVPSGRPAPGLIRSALGVGVLAALVATVLPVAGIALVFMALALALGGLIAGSPRGSASMLLAAVLGAVVAFVLHVPWSLDYVLPGAELASFVGADTGTRSLEVIDLIGLRTESSTVGVLGLGVVIAGGLALVIGRGWRLDWAARGWSLTLCGVGAALAADRGLFPFSVPPAEVLLAPACAGLALAVGLGVAAFERDLSAYRFGWRQLAAGVAGASLVIGTVPVLIASFGGTWSVPGGDYNEILAFVETERAETPFRVLWLGRPDALPLGSYELEPGLGYGTTDHGLPELGDAIVAAAPGSADLVADGLDLVLAGETTRLGQLLGPLGIRYVIVVDQLAPAPFDDDPRPTPQGLLPALSAQLDLEVIDVNPALTVFRNDDAVPLRAEVDDQFGPGTSSITDPGADLGAATPALVNETDRTTFDGPVEAGTRVFWSVAATDNWALSVDGQPVTGDEVFGFATAYEVDTTGEAELVFETPVVRFGMLVVQVLLWLFVLRTLLRFRLAPDRDGSSA
jgi:GT2 family glycosyltransferase